MKIDTVILGLMLLIITFLIIGIEIPEPPKPIIIEKDYGLEFEKLNSRLLNLEVNINQLLNSKFSQSQENIVYNQNVEHSHQCRGLHLRNFDLMINVHKTGSMRPYIFSGDILLTTSYNTNRELVGGDVVSANGVLHRVVGIKYCNWGTRSDKTCVDYFTMKGDNNLNPDGVRYSPEDIDYIVCGVLRKT